MAIKPKTDKPKLLDKILEFPYRKLFGRTGKIVIVSSLVIFLGIKFFLGIATVRLDPKTCKLSNWDVAYLLFHKKKILSNTSKSFQKSMRENQIMLRHINDGINPLNRQPMAMSEEPEKSIGINFFGRLWANAWLKKTKRS